MCTFHCFTIAVLTLLTLTVRSQNLVPNPDFETTGNCVAYWAQLEAAPPWFNPTTSTPDYFYGVGECGYNALNNASGFQLPHSGVAYAGLWSFTTGGIGTREYIEIKLSTPLNSGVAYTVKFYVSRAEECRFASDRIGAYFSEDSVVSLDYIELPFIPQVENAAGNILTDTVNWTQISGQFVASGGESYMTIGNFRNEAGTQWIEVNPLSGWGCAYYYIDDVEVLEAMSSSLNHSLEESMFVIKPNPAEGDDKVQIRVNDCIEAQTLQVALIDLMGRPHIAEYSLLIQPNETWLQVQLPFLVPATYLAIIRDSKHTSVQRLVVH